jgi:transcriptional regulator with PAS, ATPase and Fis domain
MMEEAFEKLFRNGWISRRQYRILREQQFRFHSTKDLIDFIEKQQWIDSEDRNEVQSILKHSAPPRDFHLLRGSLNPRMEAIYNTAKKMAEVDTTILILGESGVGKSRLARMIHERSKRKNHPFITVSCGSIPETLLESELFGVEKGAFTGAHRSREGKFVLANHGTIFLDEVAELPLSLQVKLLRVIQEKTIEPLGSGQEITVDVRIIAATNRDIENDVKKGLFREDLYFRLNVVPMTLLPLRERREDIENLTRYFLDQFQKKYNRHFEIQDPILWNILNEYDWPGNVRELENTIERLCVLAEGSALRYEDLPDRILQHFQKMIAYQESRLPLTERRLRQEMKGYPTLEDMERDHIIRTLVYTGGKLTEAAELMGIHRNTLRQKIERYRIDLEHLPLQR